MKPLTFWNKQHNNRSETGMHTFSGPVHVVLVMEYPDEEECSLGADQTEMLPRYFQVHCPQYEAPMIFNATKQNLVSYWNWQAQ